MEALNPLFEWLAAPHEADTKFRVLAVLTLLVFAGLAALMGRLVLDALKALRGGRSGR